MKNREAKKLKSQICEPLLLPIIGRCLQKKAVTALAEDGSPNAIRVLAEIVITLEDEEIKSSIFDILNCIKNQGCIDSFCDVWANTRHRDLTSILVKQGWVATAPANIRVLSALKTNDSRAIANDGEEIVEPLLNSFEDSDPEIANRASQCALSLTNSEAIDAICHLALEESHQLACQIAMKAQYTPHEPSQKALFYFLTEQWDKYESLDYDHTLLQKVYELGSDDLRKQIAEKARKAGRAEWVRIVAGGRKGERVGEMTDAEWETTITVLSRSRNWEEMWRLAQKAPVIWSRKMLLKLDRVTWIPQLKEDKIYFEQLKWLSYKCSEDIPVMGRLIRSQVTIPGNSWTKTKINQTGNILATWDDYRDGVCRKVAIKLWQIPSGQPITTIDGHTRDISRVLFHPDGNVIITCGGGGTINIWRISDNKFINNLISYDDEKLAYGRDRPKPYGISLSPNGNILASYGVDKGVRLWQMPDGNLISILSGHDNAICGIEFSPNGQILASYDSGGTIKLWQIPNGDHISSFIHCNKQVLGTNFSPNGQILASYAWDSFEVKLWQVPDGKLITSFSSRHESIAGENQSVLGADFSPNGKIIVSYDIEKTYIWKVPEGKLIISFATCKYQQNHINFSPDGKIFANCDGNKINLWKIPEGKLVASLTNHKYYINSISFSSDGKILASADTSAINLWQIPESKLIFSISKIEHNNHVCELKFTPDGQILCSRDSQEIKLWSSDLPRLVSLPVKRLNRQDIKLIKTLLDEIHDTGEKYWVKFIYKLLELERRFDVDVEDTFQLVNTSKFEIEIEG